MTCRAPTGSTTCVSPQTGAQLSYDPAGQLTTWVNRPGGTTTDQFLYDGEGQRVAQQVTTGGATTTTVYVGALEEVSTTGGTTNTTTYYAAGGLRIAEAVNGVFSYLGSDGLGSAVVALDGSSTLQASILYGPYGGVRYTNGTMPGSYGFTGQRADATTGLDYYNARYYDLTAKQFVTADTVQDGLNRYGYVAGNPTTYTDPSGHYRCDEDDCRHREPGDKPTPSDPPGKHHDPGKGDGGGGCAPDDQECRGQRAKANFLGAMSLALDGLSALLGVLQVARDWIQLQVDLALPSGLDKTLSIVSDIIALSGDLIAAGIGVAVVASH
jgi:RHS repeat-associated protein